MGAVSGQYAKIMIGSSNVVECTGWSWERSVADHAYASCATGGWKKRVAGTKDHTGSLNGKFDPTDEIEGYFDEGDLVTLKLYVSTTAYYSVPAMITSLSIETNVDEGDIIPWTANFGGNGAWSSSGF